LSKPTGIAGYFADFANEDRPKSKIRLRRGWHEAEMSKCQVIFNPALTVYHLKRKDIQLFWRTRQAYDPLGIGGRISGMLTEPGDSERNSWVLQKVVALLSGFL
jgi:hypothetical protein